MKRFTAQLRATRTVIFSINLAPVGRMARLAAWNAV